MPMSIDDLARELATTVLHRELGLEVIAVDEASLTMRMPIGRLSERLPDTGQFHGGAIATLIDVAGDMVLMAALGHGVPTINFRVDFLRPATGAALTAVAESRRTGKTVAVVDIDVFDSEQRLVATGRGCYSSKAG